MCGIAGIIGRLDQTNAAALQRMNRALVHRGPDAEGSWQSPPDADGRGFLLTHRRLSILDLSPLGAQPMADELTGDVIAYNGEVYNYVELRDRLAALGHHFESTGDTAVVLRDLALNGASALPGLRGMFALAFWDADAHRLRLARDPLGIKPLYVARNRDASAGWSVAFASEVRALLASGLLGTPRLDPQAVASMVWNGFVMAPGTAVSGVELLAAGSTVEFDARGRETHAGTFWTVAPGPPTDRIDEDQLAALLEEDVRLHLASDVPLAVFLSGGIDSSAIANLAARAQSAPVHTFTLAFEERELNEGPAARRIAAAIGTQHTEVVLTEPEFVGHLEGALNSLDQPTFDGLNAYYMSRSIRSAGFTVALSGTGGDELFGGYSSFRDLPVLHRWSRRLRFVPRGLLTGLSRLGTAGLRRSGAAVPPQTRWAKLPGMVQRGDDLIALYQLAYALFLPDFQRDLLDPRAPPLRDGLPAAMRDRLLGETKNRPALSAISVLEQRLFLGERLLRDNDAASMAVSLEQRVPLVDQALFEAVDRLDPARRYSPIGRKEALRRMGLRGLDAALFERPKSGFVLPFDRWIRQGLRKTMDESFRDERLVRSAGLSPPAVGRLWRSFLDGAPGMYWSRVWSLYVLMRWCQQNGVSM